MTTSPSKEAGSRFDSDRRYNSVAIVLHWTIALLILVQMGLGWYMNEWLPDHSAAQAAIETLHVSLGLTTFLLILVRIGVRLSHPAPPLPAGLHGWERVLAGGSHWLFYGLMLALPLTGWAMVSIGHRPIGFWGLQWPHLPRFSGMGKAEGHVLRETLQNFHTYVLIWLVLGNLALHVAGALKHQFDGHPVLWRMLPLLKRPGA